MVERGSINGAALALEISEELPENWKQSIPVVLEALREVG